MNSCKRKHKFQLRKSFLLNPKDKENSMGQQFKDHLFRQKSEKSQIRKTDYPETKSCKNIHKRMSVNRNFLISDQLTIKDFQIIFGSKNRNHHKKHQHRKSATKFEKDEQKYQEKFQPIRPTTSKPQIRRERDSAANKSRACNTPNLILSEKKMMTTVKKVSINTISHSIFKRKSIDTRKTPAVKSGSRQQLFSPSPWNIETQLQQFQWI